MNRSITRGLCVCLSVVALASCQDYEGGFSESQIKEAAYAKNFVKAFGEIDPNQDFNLATRATANVNLDEAAQVKIYTLNPMVNGAKMIADISSDKISSFNFDMIEGTSEVFVQAVSKRGAIINGYMPVTDGVLNINSGKVETRASGTCNTTVSLTDPATLHVYYGDEWDQEANGGWGAWAPVTKSFTMYSLENVHKERAANPWKVSDFKKVLDTYTDSNGDTQNGVFKEQKNNYETWVRTGTLTGDVMFTMAETGPVSVTLNYRRTSTTTNQLAYFYWKGNEFPTPENIKLYSLIPDATALNDLIVRSSDGGNTYPTAVYSTADFPFANTNDLVKGTTYDLVYFGEDGNGTPSFDFEENVHIGFAVVQDNKQDGSTQQKTDKVWFSIQSLNIPSAAWGKGTNYHDENFPAAATFKMGDVTFLGFEDWPDYAGDGGGSDLNDLLFFAVGNFQEEIPDIDPDPEPDPTPEPQEWMLVYEDLGNSLDWDYNDVVLKVGHTTGSNKLIITPMAAGGTLASYVKFNGSNVGAGEIHQLLGASAKNSGSYTPINADSRADGTPIEITLTAEQDAAFTMTTLGAANAQGGITLHVVPAGNAGETGIENSTVIAYSLTNKGKAPEVICLPASWNYTNSVGKTMSRTFRWPAECKHIDDAYSGFASWVTNKTSNTEWYKADPNSQYCITGTFEIEVSEPSDPSGDGGNTGDNTPADTRTEMVIGQEYSVISRETTDEVSVSYTSSILKVDFSNYKLPSSTCTGTIEVTIDGTNAQGSYLLTTDGTNLCTVGHGTASATSNNVTNANLVKMLSGCYFAIYSSAATSVTVKVSLTEP